MSDQNKEVLIRINIDEGTYRKKIVDLAKEIINVKHEEQELAKAIKLTGTATHAQLTRQEELKAQLKDLTRQQRQYQNVLELKTAADQAAAGSVDQLRAQAKLLRMEWDELSKEEKENAEIGGVLATQIGAVNAQLSEESKLLKENAQAQVQNTKDKQHAAGSVDAMKAHVKDLKAQWAALSDEEREHSEVGQELARQIGLTNSTIKEQEKTLKDNENVVEHATGSVYALREEYGELQKRYYELSEEERKSKFGQQMQKDLLKLNEEISKAEQSIGVFSRNVGNYSKSLLEAIDGSGQLSGAIETLKTTYEGLSDMIGSAKEAIMAEAKEKIAAKAATDAHTGATNASTTASNISRASIIGNVAALKLLKFALAATGIGAILILLGGLISFLTRTQEGMNKVAQITGFFGGVLDSLTHNLSDVGKGIVGIAEAFAGWFDDVHDLGDLLKKLGSEILDNLTSRLKGFAVILEGIRNGDMSKLTDGFVQAGTGITNATDRVGKLRDGIKETVKEAGRAGMEMANLVKLEQELNREKVLNASTSKLLLRDIEALKNIRDDETRTLQERQEANAKAYELEKRRNAELSDLARREMDLLIDKAAATANLGKAEAERIKRGALNNTLTKEQAALLKLTDDELQNVITAQNELFDIQEDSNGKQNEFITNRVSLLREASEKEKEIIEKRAAHAKELSEAQYAALQKRLEDERAALEVSTLQTPEGSEERLEAIIELAKKEMEIELSAKELTENQKKLIQVKFDQEEIAARKEHAQKILDVAKAQAEEWAKIKKEEYEQTIRYTDEYYAREKLKATQALADGTIGQAQYQARLEEIQRQSLETQLVNAKDYGEKTTAIEQAIAERNVAIRQREADDKIAIAKAQYELAITVTNGLGDLATILAKQQEDASVYAKAVTLFELSASSVAAMGNIIEGAAVAGTEVAKVSGPAAPVAGPLAAAAYYATNVAMILKNVAAAKLLLTEDPPKAPQFRKGTVLRGLTHEQGGIQLYGRDGAYYGEAEEGEPILTAGVSRNPQLLAAASAINVAAGGRPLVPSRYNALGGTLPPATREYLAGQTAMQIDYGKMAQAMEGVRVEASWTEGERVGKRIKFRETMVNI